MLKCKRTFDYLSLYDTNQEQATAASYYPSRKRLCNEFDEEFDTAAPLSLNCFETQGLVLPKIPLSPPSTKTQFPLHSFSSPLLYIPQNENSPNNSKLYCINNNNINNNNINNNNSIFNSQPIFSQNNNFFSNTPNVLKNNQSNNNNISINNNNNNNNDNSRRFNVNKNNNNNINNNINNNECNGDKITNNYFIVNKETIGNIQFSSKVKKEEKDSNPLLDQLIQSKLNENKYKKNADFIFTIEDIKEIVLKAIKERDEELHEEFSAQFSEKLFEQQEQFASYSEEKISAQLRNSKHNYMS